MKVTDEKTGKKIGVGKIIPKENDSNMCELIVTPQKGNTTYYHLSFRVTIPQPYKTMVEMETISFNGANMMVESAIKEYESLIKNKIKITLLEYNLESDSTRPYSKSEMREKLDEYLQIPHQINLLKEKNEFTTEKYTRLLNKKQKLEEKLKEYHILNEDGSF